MNRFQNGKKLLATTDYWGNIFRYQGFMTKSQLDDLNKKLSLLGVTRHQWLVDTTETYYDEYPLGFDLLAEAVKSAHAHGLEFFAVIKPFEAGGYSPFLPLTMPFPENAVAFKDLHGICPVATPFASENPQMNLKRKPGTYEFNGPVTAIRLIKSDDNPTRIKPEHLSVKTSSTNNNFIHYNWPVSFRETIEWRFRFPKWRECRVLHLEGFKIPENHKYILIECSLADNSGDFSNENGNILELVRTGGEIVPHTLSTGRITLEEHNKSIYQSELKKQLFRYFHLTEVQREIEDKQKMREHYRDFYNFFESGFQLSDWTTLDKQGFIAAAFGKPEYMLGNLHPIYPEVRRHWLDLTQFCLDCGVDGISFRVANHTRSPESWEYGFNEPVLEASAGKTDYPTISSINGNTFTKFLREARQLVKSQGKTMMVHLNAEMLMPDNRGRQSPLPPNFEWQWENWVNEIADELEFRGGYMLQPWNLNKALDLFSAATRAANKPLYYQSDFHSMTNSEGRMLRKKQEVELVKNHQGFDGLVLYTTNNYTIMNENGGIEVLPFLKNALRSYYK
jgi:hypothetical protein